MKSVYKLELKSMFTSFRGWLFLGLTLFLQGVFITFYNLYSNQAGIEYSLELCSVIYMLCVPLLTVCTFASDRKSGFDKMLFSIVKDTKAILLGKTLALLTVSSSTLILPIIMPVILSLFGKVNFLSAYIGILGYALVTIATALVGIFVSTVTKGKLICSAVTYGTFIVMYLARVFSSAIPINSFVSFTGLTVIVLVAAVAVYFVSGSEFFTFGFIACCEAVLIVLRFTAVAVFSSLFENILNVLSVLGAYDGFIMGLFKLSSVVAVLTVIAAMAAFSWVSLEKRKY